MKKFRILGLVALVLLLSVSFASAQSQAVPVIGKLHVGAGARVMLITPNGQILAGLAAEDQVFYIEKKIVRGDKYAYFGDATGFVHNCSKHGREVINVPLMFAVPGNALNDDNTGTNGNPIRVELF